jgi:acetyl esterase/lipase
MKTIFLILGLPVLLTLSSCLSINQQQSQLVNKKLERTDMDARVYKIVGRQELQLHIFYPEGYSADSGKNYPVAASFHGGGWTQGPIEWGYADAQLMASLGYVGIAVEYRLANFGNISALDCMKDANSAIRWIRLYADDLNIDPQRIVVIGHSAGGHLALSTAFFPHYKEDSEDGTISSVPNAVIALAPAVDLGQDNYFKRLLRGKASAKECSPIEHIQHLDISILIIQGTSDEILPVQYTKDFVSAMKKAGNDIELHLYPEGNHCFFYETNKGQDYYRKIISEFVLKL